MASYDFTVDTSPMAHTVDTVKGHVNGVTVAVTAMETAVIAAERSASKTICENVDKGFYTLMKSQLSQKAVAAFTEMTSKETILVQLAKALDNVRNQMQGDYNMICRRYHKLFQSLNKALEIRIRELDRPAMNIAEIKKNLVFDKLKNDSALLFSAAEETVSGSQTALSGKLKQKTCDAIKILHASAVEHHSYNNKLKSIFLDEPETGGRTVHDDGGYYLIPAILSSEESFLAGNDFLENIYTAQSDEFQNTAPIVTELERARDGFNWAPISAGEKEIIKKEFIRLCEADNPDERTGREMMRLFEANVLEAPEIEL
jgi:hypothetical protein